MFDLPSCFCQSQNIFLPVTRKASFYKMHKLQHVDFFFLNFSKLGMLLKALLVHLQTVLLWIQRLEAYFPLHSLKQVAHDIFLSPKFLVRKKRGIDFIVGRNRNGHPDQASFQRLKLFYNIPHRRSLQRAELETFRGKWEGVGMEDREPVILFILPAICYLFGNLHKSSWSSGTYGTFLILVITVIANQKRGLNRNFLTLALYLLETEIAFDGVEGALCIVGY